jgi:uncharacterized protein YqhQ
MGSMDARALGADRLKVDAGQVIGEGVALQASDWRVAVVRRATGELVEGAARPRPVTFASVPVLRDIVAWLVLAPAEAEWAANVVASEGPVAELPPPGKRSPGRIAARLVFLVLGHAAFQLVTLALLVCTHHPAAPASPSFQGAMVGVILLAIGVYHWFVTRIPEVRRQIQMSAALKMAIWAAADPGEPTPATLRRYPAWHLQSSLVALVLVVALLAPLTVGVLSPLPAAQGTGLLAHAVTCAVRVLLSPLALGLVAELSRALARLGRGPAVVWALAPLVLVDRLFSAAPDEASLEVAATALRALRARCGRPRG